MNIIKLEPMTRQICHELFKGWKNDASTFMDLSSFEEYSYDEKAVDRYYDLRQDPSRIMFAIMLNGRPIGALDLKKIDREKKECTLSIHLQNDDVKNKGYGTEAERLALKYAFERLGMDAVNADTIMKNERSQHVLEKIGFQFIREENGFRYYRIEKKDLKMMDNRDRRCIL